MIRNKDYSHNTHLKKTYRLLKIRPIHKYKDGDEQLGVSLPAYLSKKWKNIFVTIKESGNSIILTSGAVPLKLTKKDIYKLSVKKEAIEI